MRKIAHWRRLWKVLVENIGAAADGSTDWVVFLKPYEPLEHSLGFNRPTYKAGELSALFLIAEAERWKVWEASRRFSYVLTSDGRDVASEPTDADYDRWWNAAAACSEAQYQAAKTALFDGTGSQDAYNAAVEACWKVEDVAPENKPTPTLQTAIDEINRGFKTAAYVLDKFNEMFGGRPS